MRGWKWLWYFLALFLVSSLVGFGLTFVGEKSFTLAECVLIFGNFLLLVRVIPAHQIDDGHRAGKITALLLGLALVSIMEVRWVESRRAAALAMEAQRRSNQPMVVPVPTTESSAISTTKPKKDPVPPILKQPVSLRGPDARNSKVKFIHSVQAKPQMACDNALPFKITSREPSSDIRKPFRVWIEIRPDQVKLPPGPEGRFVQVFATETLMSAMLLGPTANNSSNPGVAGIGDPRMAGNGRFAQVWLKDSALFNRSPSVFALFESDRDFDITCVQEGPLPINPTQQ